MELIGLIIFGAVIGALARLFLRREQTINPLEPILLGVAGALSGYYLPGLLGVAHTSGVDWLRWIISVLVAMAAIAAYIALRARSHARR